MLIHGTVNSIKKAVAVTPNDTTALVDGETKGIYVGGAGNAVLTMANGTDVTLNGIAVGVIHNLSVTHVKSTGTTATNIVALY